MLIRDLGEAQLSSAYGIRFQQIYPQGGEDAADWGVGRSVIEPNGTTTAHAHEENELFIFTAGTGQLCVGDEIASVSAGQAVFVPIGTVHQIANISRDERLHFFNVYWPASFGSVDL